MGTEYGDRGAALAGEILRTVVGSGVHGIAIPGTDDHDEMGVYIEPPEVVLGIGTLTLPMPDAERVLAVKRGERSREDVSAEIADIEARIRHLLDSGATALPATADHGRINAWAVAAQRSSWGW